MKIQKNDLFMGIDTSNYTTSVAIVDSRGKPVADCRKMLEVPKGQRGLRQQEAVFQHVKNMGQLVKQAFDKLNEEAGSACNMKSDRELNKTAEFSPRPKICALAASSKPRNQEGSYMPVFMVGEMLAKSLAASLGVDFIETNHQEGHVYAIKEFSDIKDRDSFFFFHISGGTSEICSYSKAKLQIIGGSKDISLGQLLDRLGVKLGLDFPAGSQLDQIAIDFAKSLEKGEKELPNKYREKFKKIKIDDLYFNLSGIESALMRALDKNYEGDILIYITFVMLSDLLKRLVEDLHKRDNSSPIVLAGGVSQSRFIRTYLNDKLSSEQKKNLIWGKYGSDNAIGVALLAREKYYDDFNKEEKNLSD